MLIKSGDVRVYKHQNSRRNLQRAVERPRYVVLGQVDGEGARSGFGFGGVRGR